MVEHYIILAFCGLLIIVALYAGFFTNKHVKATRNRSLGFLVLSWFSWALTHICTIVASIVESYFPHDSLDFTANYWKYIIVAGFFFQILGVFSLTLFVDENSQSTAGLVKITMISIIGSLYIIIPFVTDQLQFSPISVFRAINFLFWVQLAFGLYYFLIYLLWIIRIWRNSPKSLKRVTTVLFIMYITSSLIAIGAYLSSYASEVNIIGLYLFHAGVILSITIAIRVEPRIINILPFVADRLLVINRTSGMLIYEFTWTGEERRELSSFIHGIQRVSHETFKVGELKGLNLDEGLVILDYSEKLTYALLTTKSTKYLQYCFKNFKEDFQIEIDERKLNIQGVINSSDFEFGNKLVENYFKYIPSRKEI